MKKIIFLLIFLTSLNQLKAQHVRVRLNFPAGVQVNAPGRAPFAGAIWIGPEWQWRGGNYIHVPGYWAKPHHYGVVWIPGHWKYSRWGYKWVPGHWR